MAAPGSLRHVPEGFRYEYVIDATVVGVLDYRVAGDQIVMHHTYTTPEHRGNGIAGLLVAGALDDVRRSGRHVVPTCWFVAKYIDAHPEYHDLFPEACPDPVAVGPIGAASSSPDGPGSRSRLPGWVADEVGLGVIDGRVREI